MTLKRRQRAARTTRAVVVALLLLFAWAPSAFGHAAFLESSPRAGSRLEAAPREIVLRFTEPLNRKLTTVKLVDTRTGEEVASGPPGGSGTAFVFRPVETLPTAAYRVVWHTVSTEDGHALEGRFSFGVKTAAGGDQHQVEQSPLARAGWVRITLRGLLYAALFFFAGGVLTAALLARRGDLASWLVPDELAGRLRAEGLGLACARARAQASTLAAGRIATLAAVAAALAEAVDAGAGLSARGVVAFLLSNAAGLGRVVTVAALALAVALAARRCARWSAAAIVTAFLAIAVSGHANSAEPRALAIATDWLHLAGAAVWAGGIAQIVAAWGALVRGTSPGLRRQLMRAVLERFGVVALPAFLLVAVSGLINALIQLGGPAALVETAYGRVLALKIALVGVIALASYWHARRLRPRLLAADPHGSEHLERRHWRLLRFERAASVVVVAAAALLVAFPLPPRQLAEASAGSASACDPCPVARAAADELPVADDAGSSIVAGWLRRDERGLSGTVRVLGRNQTPVEGARIPNARTRACGPGCLEFRTVGHPRTLAVDVPERGRLYRARLPARWRVGESTRARRLLGAAQRTMRGLRSVQEEEQVTSGPGSFAHTVYRLEAPDRLAYRTDRQVLAITIGTRQWFSAHPRMPWKLTRYGGGGPPFRTRSWFRWTTYGRSVRLLRLDRQRRRAVLVLMDEATPVWFRLTVDLGTLRVLRARMIADGHFMDQRFFNFNRPLAIRPPEHLRRDG